MCIMPQIYSEQSYFVQVFLILTLLFLQTQLFQLVRFSSVAQSCLTFRDPMNCNTPGLPVHHQLPEFTQTHVYQVGNAIQLSHPL